MSIEDLVELLHSVDHEKVVSSKDAVISDAALEALLDRTLSKDKPSLSSPSSLPTTDQSSFKERKDEGDTLTASASGSTNTGSSTVEHASIFKVIAERDSKGNLITSGDNQNEDHCQEEQLPFSGDAAPSTDSTVSTSEAENENPKNPKGDLAHLGDRGSPDSTTSDEKAEKLGGSNASKSGTRKSLTPRPPSTSSGSIRSSSVTSSTTGSEGSDMMGVVITESVVGVCTPTAEGERERGDGREDVSQGSSISTQAGPMETS